MAYTQPSRMKCRGGGEEVNNLIQMMNLIPASPLEAICDAPGTHKGRMLANSPQDSPALPDSSLKDCIDLSHAASLQTSEVEREVRQGLQVDGGGHTDSGKTFRVERPTAWPVQRSGSTQPRSLHMPESVRTGPEVDLGSESVEPSNLVVAWSQSFPSVEPLVVSRHEASSHAQPELWQSREESDFKGIKTPSPSSVIPVLEKLLSSSDKSHSGSSNTTSSSEYSDSSQSDKQTQGDCVDATVVQRTFSRLQESLQGFLFGHSKEHLEDFLVKIVSKPRDFGIYINNQFNPSPDEGVMRYRKGKEFTVKKTIHVSEHKHCGVFLCVDNHSQQQFVLKTIMMHNKRLVGIEFLTRQNKAFLPKIYGVYKEKDIIHIFEEFVEGGTLLTCDWSLAKVRQFAETLLSAFHYLHTHDLAHCDVKLMNLMVRDPLDPESLVLIDFESAKHPQYPFYKGGHTVTYLPPWYDRILNLNSYDPVLKTADLWAIACVIIFFLLPSDRCDVQEHKWGVWNQALEDIKSRCHTCRHTAGHSRKFCDVCKKHVMLHIKSHGHKILDIHLGHLMESNIDDPDWLALKNVLKYLTDTENIEEKHIDIALSIVRDPAENLPDLPVQCSSSL